MSRRSSRGLAPHGPNRPGVLKKIHHKASDVWECRVCHYKANCDKVSPNCINCGRDFWGNPGVTPVGLGRGSSTEGVSIDEPSGFSSGFSEGFG